MISMKLYSSSGGLDLLADLVQELSGVSRPGNRNLDLETVDVDFGLFDPVHP